MQTDESADEQILLDRDRLKFVTENFHSLQGLAFVWVGAFFSISDIVASPLGKSWPTLARVLNLAGMAVAILYLRFLRDDDYYEKRFGKVEQKAKPVTPVQAWGCLFIFAFLLICVVIQTIWGAKLDPVVNSSVSAITNQIHLQIGDAAHEINLWGLLYAIFMLASGTWTHWITRGFDLDKAILLVCGALTSICVFVSPLWYPEVKRWVLWQILNTCAMGLTFTVLGLHNHLTLIRLMPKKPLEESND